MKVERLPDGWLNDDEADLLREVARGKIVLELGAWKGRSTFVFSEVAALVVSVDRHLGIPVATDTAPSLDTYLENVGHLDNVIAIVGDWHRCDFLSRTSFDLVYVDGNHDVSSAAADFGLASDFHCSIAAHDWDFDSVRAGAFQAGLPTPDLLAGSVVVWQ